MNDHILLTPIQKLKKAYTNISSFICIFIGILITSTYLITSILIFIANKVNSGGIISIFTNSVMHFTDTISKVDALIYVSFVLSIFISFFISNKLAYLLRFNNVRYRTIRNILTTLFNIAFAILCLLLVGSILFQNILQPIHKPITTFFINLFRNFIPSLYMFNNIIGIK